MNKTAQYPNSWLKSAEDLSKAQDFVRQCQQEWLRIKKKPRPESSNEGNPTSSQD